MTLIIASLTVCIHCRTEPAEESPVAGAEVTTTTPCEAYNLVSLGHEYEDLLVYQKRECETSIAQCPADTSISKSGDEDVGETAQSS